MTHVAPNNDDDDDGFIRVVSKWRPSSLAPITVVMTHADETSLIIHEKNPKKNTKIKITMTSRVLLLLLTTATMMPMKMLFCLVFE